MMMQIQKEELVNPALLQKIMKLEKELAQSEMEKRQLRKTVKLQGALLGEYRRGDLARYEEHVGRREKRREIATEWIVAGGVTLFLVAATQLLQWICLTRWGLMP